ncbi:MAG: DUF87 domain-containing protein, partial [Acidobacteriia bacterium]|nr:DUF87 domain-containing protein [Terriglobia bacterium]
HLILLGRQVDGISVQVAPYGRNILVAGPSGSGKSTFTAGVVERLIEKDYQVCIVDPEGDYGAFGEVVALGNQWRAPSVDEVLSILEDPKINLSVNLLGIPLEDRPGFFAQLVPRLSAMRSRTGRPHWLVLDEAHHMLPDTWGHTGSASYQMLMPDPKRFNCESTPVKSAETITAASAGTRMSWLSRTLRIQMAAITHVSALKNPGLGAR